MRVLAGFLLVLSLAAGCASDSEEPGEPQPADALALEVESLASGPLYALYEDGRLFSPAPQVAVYPGPALPAFTVAQLEPERVADLLDTVLRSGVLEERGTEAPSGDDDFVVTIRAAEKLRTVRLGPGRSQSLLGLLADLPLSGTDRLYEPHALAVVAAPPEPSYEEPDEREWPLGELAEGCSVVAGEDLEPVLTAAAQANQLTRWRTSEEILVSVRFRPLLPHEESCADVAGLAG